VWALEPTTTADSTRDSSPANKQASIEAAWTRHWEALRLVHNLQAWIWHCWNPEECEWIKMGGGFSYRRKNLMMSHRRGGC
jgi:hypothetical protein